MLGRIANIPPVNSLGSPRLALLGSFVEDDTSAQGSKGHSVGVECAIQMGFGQQQAGVEARESELSLSTPEIRGSIPCINTFYTLIRLPNAQKRQT